MMSMLGIAMVLELIVIICHCKIGVSVKYRSIEKQQRELAGLRA